MHHRLSPKRHRFRYEVFMFWLDLDALNAGLPRLRLMGVNKRNIYSFQDSDHLKYPKGDGRNSLPLRIKLNNWLSEQGITTLPDKVFLLTHQRLFGYVFNPVSFYFCFDIDGRCTHVVTEVSNTFGEMKLFLTPLDEQQVHTQVSKYFYVSPFTDLNDAFTFYYSVPTEKLNMRIDTSRDKGERFFISTLTGKRRTLSDGNLLRYLFRFPFMTLKVITAIHWQAFLLYLKKLPWRRKADEPELQKDILNAKRRND